VTRSRSRELNIDREHVGGPGEAAAAGKERSDAIDRVQEFAGFAAVAGGRGCAEVPQVG
jgi:hypothetical protein